ncbi:MAG: hypothetical protein ACXVC6_12300 [Bacteroidia bacterium]
MKYISIILAKGIFFLFFNPTYHKNVAKKNIIFSDSSFTIVEMWRGRDVTMLDTLLFRTKNNKTTVSFIERSSVAAQWDKKMNVTLEKKDLHKIRKLIYGRVKDKYILATCLKVYNATDTLRTRHDMGNFYTYATTYEGIKRIILEKVPKQPE